MNAIVALLTAASVLAHAALGCCVHHSHATSAVLAAQDVASAERNEHHACGHCCHLRQNADDDEPLPAHPGGCDERDCVAVAGTTPILLLKAAVTAFNSMPLADLLTATASSADYVQWAGLEHDLGPPVRPHLFNCVLLI